MKSFAKIAVLTAGLLGFMQPVAAVSPEYAASLVAAPFMTAGMVCLALREKQQINSLQQIKANTPAANQDQHSKLATEISALQKERLSTVVLATLWAGFSVESLFFLVKAVRG